jgi:hypothetical protein
MKDNLQMFITAAAAHVVVCCKDEGAAWQKILRRS